jgi:hypothetical protein
MIDLEVVFVSESNVDLIAYLLLLLFMVFCVKVMFPPAAHTYNGRTDYCDNQDKHYYPGSAPLLNLCFRTLMQRDSHFSSFNVIHHVVIFEEYIT